jgi:predicted phosphodiesterase
VVRRREFIKALTLAPTGLQLAAGAALASEPAPNLELGPGTQLFGDDWSATEIDPAKWNFDGDVSVVRLADGSAALKIGYIPSGWSNTIMSRQRFARGGNLRVTYRLWGEGIQAGGTDGLVQGPGSCVYGPWHDSFFELASYFTLEAGLSQGGQDFSITENRNFRQGRLPDNEAFTRALAAATTRESALTIRVVLGNASGALFQWKLPQGNWNTSHDTRESKQPGSRMSRNVIYREAIGHAPHARIGFATNHYAAYIADLTVETDLTEPEYRQLADSLPAEPARVARAKPVPWTKPLVEPAHSAEEFRFAITSDLTGNYRKGVFEQAVERINLMRPDFTITVGDLVEGYVDNDTVIRNEFEWFDAMANRFDAPFFYVAGNHDVSVTWKDNDRMLRIWRQRYGPDYYSFIYRDVLFLCLNSNDQGHYVLREQQQAWALKTLDDHRSARWTIVICHDPLWEYKWDTGWSAIEAALGERPYTVFSGHYHRYAKFRRNERDYYILAATGGGTQDNFTPEAHGVMDHFAWVTMTAQGPLVANVMLPGIVRDDVITDAKQREFLDSFSGWMEARAKEQGLYKPFAAKS